MRKIGFIGLPGMYIIGGGSAAEPVMFTPIDMLAATLDSRIAYKGPSHLVRSATGLAVAAANEWPIQYVNGNAVGRHEPEKASVNYVVENVDFDGFSTNLATGVPGWQFFPGTASYPVSALSENANIKSIQAPATMNRVALYNEAESKFLVAETSVAASSTLADVKFNATVATESMLRFYTQRNTSSAYVYGRTIKVPAQDVTMSMLQKTIASSGDTEAKFIIALPQIEPGKIRTSPILNDSTIAGNRDESTATVTQAGATKMIVSYNDDSTVTVEGNGSFVIPATTADWGTRYITKLEFEA